MHGIHVDLRMVAAIWMFGALAMLPLLALTIRFALVPLLDAITRARRVELRGRRDAALAMRFAAMEARLDELAQRGRSADRSGSVPGNS
jgi:hypothetical protein